MAKSKKFQSKLASKKGPGGGNKDRRGQSGPKNVFQVKHTKANKTKHKTKAVTTSLTKIMNQKKGLSPLKINEEYKELQDTLHRSIPADTDKKRKQVLSPQSGDKSKVKEAVNIDETMEQLSSL